MEMTEENVVLLLCDVMDGLSHCINKGVIMGGTYLLMKRVKNPLIKVLIALCGADAVYGYTRWVINEADNTAEYCKERYFGKDRNNKPKGKNLIGFAAEKIEG